MPLLTTTGVSPSLHTWREYDCFMLQMLENILFTATRMPCSYTGSLNFTLLVLQSSKSWVKSKLRNGKETPWPLTGWLVSQPQSWVMSLQLPTGWCGGCGAFQRKVDASNQAPGSQTSLVLQRWGRKEKVTKYYWNLAGFETITTPKHKVEKLVEAYQDQIMKRNMSNKKSIEDRKKF